MKIASWNLNGLAACLKNGVMDAVGEIEPDILCLQEIRTRQEPVILDGYRRFWNHGLRVGDRWYGCREIHE